MHANRAGSFVGQLLMLIPMGIIMHSGVTGTSLVLSGYGEPCHQWHHDCMTNGSVLCVSHLCLLSWMLPVIFVLQAYWPHSTCTFRFFSKNVFTFN